MNADKFLRCLALVALSAVGCQQESATTPVSGVVTVDGVPLNTGVVTFQPVGTGEVAIGKIENGTFALRTFADGDGALPGRYLVGVKAFKSRKTGGPDERAAPMILGEPLIPLHYADPRKSGLEFEVKASGENKFPIALSSRKQQ